METERKHKQDADKFIVRLPDGMRSRIKDAAEKEDRSMNYMVVKFIEIGFKFESVQKGI